jgi:hypothetical protein
MRLGMYTVLTLGVAFVYFRLGDSWKDVYSRAALLFFVVAFLTFMAIAGFPAFIEDLKVYIRERLNGCASQPHPHPRGAVCEPKVSLPLANSRSTASPL